MNYPNITVKPHLLPLTNPRLPGAPYAPLLALRWPKLQTTRIKSNGMQEGNGQPFIWTFLLSLQIFEKYILTFPVICNIIHAYV